MTREQLEHLLRAAGDRLVRLRELRSRLADLAVDDELRSIVSSRVDAVARRARP